MRVLLIYPRFTAASFWNYAATAELVGARYPTVPLGLITVAAMLPQSWELRLVNRNTEELDPADLDWADLVMTGGMLFQQPDTLRLMAMAQAAGKPVAIGGPDITSSPHVYADADFRMLGEAESYIADFIAAWDGGQRSGTFEAPKFQADVTSTPIPRFDLLKLRHYMHVGVQFSRGCPFTCEFCDIIELFGRVPRTKATPQMLAELQALYDLGHRGHVDFVDDNLIGNKKAIRAFLPELLRWQEEHGFPFEFSTEASLNIADDPDLLDLMRRCGFFALFVGIESPDPDTLVHTKKKQNTRRDIVESVHRIYDSGMYVTAGFIIGFDSENGSIGGALADFIEAAAIPVSMVGLLYALPNTQLTRRLAAEGRLHAGHEYLGEDQGDHLKAGINFNTARPRRDVLADLRNVLARIYDPEVYCARVERVIRRLRRTGGGFRHHAPEDPRSRFTSFESAHRVLTRVPEWRRLMHRTLARCVEANPAALFQTLSLLALFHHLGPFARESVARLDEQIAAIDAGTVAKPALVPAPAPAAVARVA